MRMAKKVCYFNYTTNAPSCQVKFFRWSRMHFRSEPARGFGKILGILRMGVCEPRIHGKKPYACARRARTEHGTPVRFEVRYRTPVR